MLRHRVITAVILGVLVLGSLFYLPLSVFRILALLIVSIAAWEYSGFFARQDLKGRLSFLTTFILLAMVCQHLPALPILVVGGIWWLGAPYLLWRFTTTKSHFFTTIIKQWGGGFAIFLPCFTGLLELQLKFGPWLVLYLLLTVALTDIGAYFTGLKFGKRPLAPMISPKKTLEGLLGGILMAVGATLIGGFLGSFGIIEGLGGVVKLLQGRWVSWILLILVTCLWSVVGDLFESMLKRQVGIKDSGKLLPGHGGMYDRIDSLTAAVPIYVLGILLI